MQLPTVSASTPASKPQHAAAPASSGDSSPAERNSFLAVLLGSQATPDDTDIADSSGTDADTGDNSETKTSEREHSSESTLLSSLLPFLNGVPPAYLLPLRLGTPSASADDSTAVDGSSEQGRLAAESEADADAEVEESSRHQGKEKGNKLLFSFAGFVPPPVCDTTPAPKEDAAGSSSAGLVMSADGGSSAGAVESIRLSVQTTVTAQTVADRLEHSAEQRPSKAAGQTDVAFRMVLKPDNPSRADSTLARVSGASATAVIDSTASQHDGIAAAAVRTVEKSASVTTAASASVPLPATKTATHAEPSQLREEAPKPASAAAAQPVAPADQQSRKGNDADRGSDRKQEGREMSNHAPSTTFERPAGPEQPRWEFSKAPAQPLGRSEQSSSTQQTASPARVAPLDSAAETMRPAAIREIALSLPDQDSKGVDLHIVDKGGKVHIEVRTDDTQLAASLRNNVGDLVQKLDTAGYRTETISAQEDKPSSTSTVFADHRATHIGQKSALENDQPSSGGNGGHPGQQQQEQQQGHHRGNRPRWLEEIRRNLQHSFVGQEADNGDN